MAKTTQNCNDPVALTEGIRNNENWAYECLFRGCYPKIASWQPPGQSEGIKDLFQDALIKLRGALLNGKIIEAPCAWLFTVVKHDFFRQQKRLTSMEVYDDNLGETLDFDGPDGFSSDDWAMAYDCILALGKAEQKLLFMTFFHKFPDEQIAASLGYLNLNTMRAARSRAMSNLRFCMKDKGQL